MYEDIEREGERCRLCGRDDIRLFDAVGKKRLIRICERCSFNEHIPLIKRPTTTQLKEAERSTQEERSVEKALEKVSGIRPKKREERLEEEQKRQHQEEEDRTLKKIVDQHYAKKYTQSEGKPRTVLIDQFHWVIMRARRQQKLTQLQLATKMGESEIAVRMAERGKLPEDEEKLIAKFEHFLGIRLRADTPASTYDRRGLMRSDPTAPARSLDFDRKMLEDLTIADLKHLKMQERIKQQTQLPDDFSSQESAEPRE